MKPNQREHAHTAVISGTHSFSVRNGSSYLSHYNAVIQDSRMTIESFIQTKFIPEHVVFKTRAGQTHYQAMLKHLITPALVNGIFRSGSRAKPARLNTIAEWPYLDGVRLCDLNASHVGRLIHAANLSGYSTQTVTHIKNVLFAVISHAQKEGCFHGANPASLVKAPKLVRQNQHDLTFQETREILERLQQPAKAIAIFNLATEMTLKQVCDLEWKHVNLGNAMRDIGGEFLPPFSLAVRASSTRGTLGKGRLADRNRIMKIREPLLSTLRNLSWLNPHPNSDASFVFSNDHDRTSVSRSFTNELRRVGNALGIPWLNWQVLRRGRESVIEEFLPRLDSSHRTDRAGMSARLREPAEAFAGHRSVEQDGHAFSAARRPSFYAEESVREA